ncbi:MAG TPA: tetratricopeptide repeat protein [Gaiellaceae bacterium]|nr:tetratricopeptide repeat protein [Gaiellaceae bacterium]
MMTDRPGEVVLPESVQGMIAARLDVLPRDEKELLQDAAVIGKVFWAGALGRERSVVDQRLRSLERKEFVRRERRATVAGETEYTFRHALVREVAYEQIPRAQRGDKHRAAAEWIESVGRPEDHAEMLAHHYVHALELRQAAGVHVEGDDVPARKALREAGDRAFALNAHDTAARYYGDAVALTPPEDPDRAELMFRLARARHISGDDFREQALEDAREALLAADEPERAAEAAALLAESCWFRGDRAACDRHLEHARSLVEGVPSSPAKSYVLCQLARYRALSGDSDEAIDLGQQALAIAEQLRLDELRAHALNSIGLAKHHRDAGSGISDLEASIEISLAIHSPEAARGLNNLGALVWGHGEPRRARELVDKAVRVAEEFGHVSVWRHARGQQIGLLIDLGDWDTGLRAADEFIAAPQTTAVEDSVRRRRARVRLARGDIDGALEDVRAMLELARAAKDPQSIVPTLASAIRVYAEAGRTEQARALAGEFFDVVPNDGPDDWMLIDFAWVARPLGRGRDLSALLDRAPRPGLYAEAARALLAGDDQRAAEVFHTIGEAENEAAARLRVAAKLIAGGQPSEAAKPLQDALAFYRSVGAKRYINEAEALLAERASAS